MNNTLLLLACILCSGVMGITASIGFLVVHQSVTESTALTECVLSVSDDQVLLEQKLGDETLCSCYQGEASEDDTQVGLYNHGDWHAER
jgi:hypothetical protein